MYKGAFVIDATVHGFNFQPDNYLADFLPDIVQMLYQGAHIGFHPKDTGKWNMTWEEFIHAFEYQPDLLEQAMFAESQTDLIVYHGVPLNGIYRDGSSPISVAKKVRERYPNRVFIYGPLYPWQPDALDEIDRLVEEDHIIGLKFYPLDLYQGQLKPSRMDAPQMWQIVERARARGIKMIAIHKAVPLGPLPLAPYNSLYDMAPIVADFPDMIFEVVHGGAAFLDETIQLMERYPNVVVNLESLPMFIPNHRAKFTELMAGFLEAGMEHRLFYATGAVGGHPQPFLEAFWDFQLPPGMPQLTDDMKRDILANNFARYQGWNIEEIKQKLATDQFGLERSSLVEPWSAMRATARRG